MILTVHGLTPDTGKTIYIAESADIIGDVTFAEDTTVWFNAVIRGDLAPISFGRGSNIQDNAVIHMNTGIPVTVGEFCSIAHGAIVHGCTIGNCSLIGMGAVVLDESVIGSSCLVAAGSLVPQGKKYPDGSLILGSPARAVRSLTEEEIENIRRTARSYIEKGNTYAQMR